MTVLSGTSLWSGTQKIRFFKCNMMSTNPSLIVVWLKNFKYSSSISILAEKTKTLKSVKSKLVYSTTPFVFSKVYLRKLLLNFLFQLTLDKTDFKAIYFHFAKCKQTKCGPPFEILLPIFSASAILINWLYLAYESLEDKSVKCDFKDELTRPWQLKG